MERKPRKRLRSYRYRTARERLMQRCALVACTVVLAVSAWQLGSYAADYIRSRRQSAELRALYNAATAVPFGYAGLPTQTPAAVVTLDAVEQTTDAVEQTPAATEQTPEAATRDPLATLAPQPYPGNPYRAISERFRKLRRQNSDIVGYLEVGDLLSEAVVQRDNNYYLRRDYRGYHNTNGAIFLDEAISLNNRPHTMILYGHNMKTGAMFGSLRNYENITYYHNSPIFTFDTMYEEGRYVIFSVAVVSLKAQAANYSGFYRLPTCTNMEREAIIADLKRLSKHSCTVDVNADDQLLLLVTCVDDDSDRRVIAARRVRDGESEDDLRRQVVRSR